MNRRATNFFVAFTLCVLSMVIVAGLNRAALENELTGAPGRVFDIQEQEEGVRITLFDSHWVTDRSALERIGQMAGSLGRSVWIMRSPRMEAARCLITLGLQQLPDEVFSFKSVVEPTEQDADGTPTG